MNHAKKASILIVDDTPQNLVALQAILSDLDQELICATSAKEALRHALHHDFAVILLDVHMPDINGFETARLIRSREKSSYTPIIFLSALNKEEADISQGYEMGAVDYIFKPINPIILKTKVKVFVDLFTKSTLAINLQDELKKRELAEQALRQLTHRMQSILTSAGEGIYGINSKGKITFANPAAAHILQTTPEQLVGKSIEEILVNKQEDKEKPVLWQQTHFHKAIAKGKTYQADNVLFRNVHNELIPVDYIVTPLLSQQEICQGAVIVFKDVRERQRAEQRARKQEHQLALAEVDRSSSMEEMTSSLAHELNQPLSAIINYVQGCIHRLTNNDYKTDQLLSALQRASQQAERAGAILHRIKDSVRKNTLYYESLFINDLITNIIFLLQDTAQEAGVNLTLKLDKASSLKTMVDKIQIEQVITNLLRNGIEALQEYKKTPRQLTIQTKINANQTFTIAVKDNGPGIAQEHAARLFDLYFTTKANGMGMGLSICRTIIEAHGGHIMAKNNPGGGACVQFTLPMRTENVAEIR